MENITDVGGQLITGLFTALFVLGVSHPFREGYLFDKWGWTVAIQDKWWSNPVALCPYCMSPWYGLVAFALFGGWAVPILALGWVVVLRGVK